MSEGPEGACGEKGREQSSILAGTTSQPIGKSPHTTQQTISNKA